MAVASTAGTVGVVAFIVALFLVVAVPAYVVGRRSGVSAAAIAFIPLVGPTIVILWSIQRSGWLSVLGLIPLVSIIFHIWLVLTVPAEQERTRWWALPFLIPLVNVIAFYVYAFTLEYETPSYEAASPPELS